MNRKLINIFIAIVFLSGNIMFAQDKTDKTIPQNTLLPSPGEVLNSLNKIGRVQWSSLVAYNKFYNYKGRYKQSLNLGVRVADAFVALHDKDKANFGEMNKVIFSLSKELHIDNIIEKQKDKLQKLSSKDDWVLLVIELNEMNGVLQDALRKQKEDDIILLSGLGGFFEGLSIVSSHFVNNYDSKKVDLLKQLELCEYYIAAIDKNSKIKKDKTVIVAYNGLKKIKKYLQKNPEISINTVKQIQATSKSIVGSITE